MFISSAPTADRVLAAKEVCGRCSVVDDCLVYAITNSVTDGIWGGLTADELRPLHAAWRSQLAATVA
jgi:WhiB family redox-sensing transcriptional regulator